MITRGRIVAVVACLLALAGAFVGGRFSAPLKVETKTVDRVVYQDRVVEKVVTVEAKAKVETRVVWRDRVITKDGTVTEHEVEKTGTKEDTTKTDTSREVATRTGSSDHEATSATTVRPDWRVGVLVGATLRDPVLPIAGPLVVGVEVDRRIIGGLSLGIWAQTQGSAGLSVSFEF